MRRRRRIVVTTAPSESARDAIGAVAFHLLGRAFPCGVYETAAGEFVTFEDFVGLEPARCRAYYGALP